LKYIKSGESLTYKKYLYAMRGLVNAKYVEHAKHIPPIGFNHTLNASSDFIPSSIIDGLKDIIKLKKKGNERDIQHNDVRFDTYIEEFLKSEAEILSAKSINDDLDKEVQKIILTGENKCLKYPKMK